MKVMYKRQEWGPAGSPDRTLLSVREAIEVPTPMLRKMAVIISELFARTDHQNYAWGIKGEYSGCSFPLLPDQLGTIPEAEDWIREWQGVSKVEQARERLYLLERLDSVNLVCVFWDGLYGNSLESGVIAKSYVEIELSDENALISLRSALSQKLGRKDNKMGATIQFDSATNEIVFRDARAHIAPSSKQHDAIKVIMDCPSWTSEQAVLDMINETYASKSGHKKFEETREVYDAYLAVKKKLRVRPGEFFPIQHDKQCWIYRPR